MKTGSNKRTIFLVGLLLVCIGVWFLTKPSGVVEDTSALSSLEGGEVDSVGASADAIALLQKTQSISFNFKILETPEFMELIDRALPLLNLPVGRDNPFAPAR